MARFGRPLAWVVGLGLFVVTGISTGCSQKVTAAGEIGSKGGARAGSGGTGNGGSGGNSNAGGAGGSGSGGAASGGAGFGGSGSGGKASGGAGSGGSGSGGKASGGAGGDNSGGSGGGGGGSGGGNGGTTGGGGQAGSAGSTGGGGAGGTSGTSTAISCETTKPATIVKASAVAISNFTPPDSAGTLAPAGIDNSGAVGTATWPYTSPVGNTYVYPAKTEKKSGDAGTCSSTNEPNYLTSSLNSCDEKPSPGEWTILGTVATWSGAGLTFWCPVDASAYNGIQFDISGDVGPSGAVTVGVTSCTDSSLATCTTTKKTITVTSSTTSVSVLWNELTVTFDDGGVGQVNRKIITGIGWSFGWYWPTDAGGPYQATLKLDNLAWLP